MSQHRLSDVTLLLRFRESRDPRAFAMLFDRYSVALWRRACKLTNECDADDLVQCTFLSVIESVESFDESCDVRPWLYGILANHVRMRARRERQQRVDYERLDAPESESSTVEVVSVREVRERLGTALSALPEPYRDVVSARYEAQLRTRDIAAASSREVGTVRKQIHRGLRMLRKALPIEVAMAALVFLSPKRLAAASRRTRFAIPSLSALGLVGILCAFFFSGDSQEPTLAAHDFAVDGTTAAVSEVVGDAAPARALREAKELDSERSSAALPRVIHAYFKDGTALAKMPLRVLERSREHFSAIQMGDGVQQLVTDARGSVDCAQLAPGDYQVAPLGGLPRAYFTVAEDGSVSRTRADFGSKRRVFGRVVDARGEPLAGARIFASASRGGSDAGDVAALSDEGGRFSLTLACEQPSIWARVADRAPSAARVLADVAEQEIVLRMGARGQRIAGTVTLASGEAPEQALVAWFPSGTRSAPIYERCDASGRFDLGEVRSGEGTIFARAPGFACSWRRLGKQSASDAIEFRLERGHSLAGIVRDPLGRPVADAYVQVTPAPVGRHKIAGSWRAKSTSTDGDGRYVLENLCAGEVVVFALATRANLRGKRFVDLPATKLCDLDCTRTRVARGRLVDMQGRALAGWTVEGLAGGGADPKMRHRWRALCVSDAEGRFELQLSRNSSYRVAVFAPGLSQTDPRRQPQLVLDSLEPGADRELRVQRALAKTTIRGRVGRAARRYHARLTLEHVEWGSIHKVAIRGGGRFAIEGIPHGRYRVHLIHSSFGRREVSDFVLARGQVHDLGICDVVAPGTLALRSDDVDLQGATVLVRDEHGAFVGRGMVGPGGRLGTTPLSPARYTVLIASRDCEPILETVDIRSGLCTTIDVRAPRATPCVIALDYHPVGMPFFRRGPVHVRLTDQHGKRVFEDIVRPDAEDLVECRCSLQKGAYRMEATCLGGRSVARTFEVGESPLRVAASMR